MKLKFHFVVGVEGTGHHMIKALMHEQLKRDDSIFEGEWHKFLAEHWDYDLRFKNSNNLVGILTRKDLKNNLLNTFNKYKNQRILHLFEHTSFPYEQPREPLRRPDIIEFSDIMEDFRDFIEVQYLVLYRNPIAATYSAIRRDFTSNIYHQAKIAESNFIYIERQFTQIPKDHYRVVHFEEFLKNPEDYSHKLIDWWGLDPSAVMQGVSNLIKPSGLSKIPKDAKSFLEDFFGERRIQQWQEFYGSNQL